LRSLVFVLWILATAPAGAERSGPAAIEYVAGQTPDGHPSALWLDAVRLLKGTSAASAAAAPRSLSDAEAAWEERIRSRETLWTARRESLAAPFRPVTPPEPVRILMGNRGAEDAFAYDAKTIAFDLSRLAAEYGDARTDENGLRIDRFFAHEYTHLLQKAWLLEHPQPAGTELERAGLAIWREGLGNYYSLSARWRSQAGRDSPAAREALARLVPVYVVRLSSLACASAEEAAALVAGLSQGPFEHKWGALPVALWLESESARRPGALRDFVQSGVAGLHALERRHLSPSQLAELEAARARSSRCGSPG
jgi:hypothetical protein